MIAIAFGRNGNEADTEQMVRRTRAIGDNARQREWGRNAMSPMAKMAVNGFMTEILNSEKGLQFADNLVAKKGEEEQ